MALPLRKIRILEVENIIQHKTHLSKAPGYDLITRKILQEVPKKALRAITQIYNAILWIEYFPCLWKAGQVIMIAKPGKNPAEVTSYRPNGISETSFMSCRESMTLNVLGNGRNMSSTLLSSLANR